MAINTAGTYLKYSTDGTLYNTLSPILSYPDMGSTPSKLDTTDLSALKMKTSIHGLQEVPDLTFEANYDKTVYSTIKALIGVQKLKLEFGETGADGAFTWEGTVDVYANGDGVDAVRKMTINCSAETEIVFAE